MSQQIHETILKNTTRAYAYCQIIDNDKGEAVDWIFLNVNPAFEQYFNVQLHEVINKQVSKSFFHVKADYDKILVLVNKSKQARKRIEADIYSCYFKRYFNFTVFMMEENSFVMLIQDISNTINNLKATEEKYKMIIDLMADQAWILDLDYKFTHLSPSVEKILGYKVDEMVNMSLDDVLTPASLFEAKNRINEILYLYENKEIENNHVFRFTAEQIKKDGSVIILEHLLQLLVDENNFPFAFMGLGRDVTEQKKAQAELKTSEEKLRLILDSTAEGVIGLNEKGNCAFLNHRAIALLGYQIEEDLLGVNFIDIIRHENRNHPLCDALINRVEYHSDEEQLKKADGSFLDVEIFFSPKIKEGVNNYALLTFLDISKRLEVQRELKESERSKSVLLANLLGMAYRCSYDPEWTMQFVSDGCYELTGYKKESLLYNRDISFNEIIHPRFRDYLWEKWKDIIASFGFFREEYMIKTASGDYKWVLEQGQPVYDEYGRVIALEGMIIDINNLKQKQQEIEYLSFHDGLTGLHNRMYFELAKKELDNEANLPLTIMYSDINGLKLINDAFGHAEGDKLIISTANVIKNACRKDDVLARVGGDEFALLLPRTDEDSAYALMQKILKKMDEANKYFDNEKYYINVSIGFGTKTAINQDINHLQKQAEDYMYRRKLLERNSLHNSLILSIQTTMYEKSQETEEHAKRMVELSRKLGCKLKMTTTELDQLALLSTLHDIGKISISESTLKKNGKLTPEEWSEIKTHPVTGYRIAMAIPELASIADFILCHHERWDGTGYPQGLKEEEIPLLSRVIAVVDAYDAMTEYRAYRRTLTQDEALLEIERNAGTQFDPHVAEQFLNMMKNMKKSIKKIAS